MASSRPGTTPAMNKAPTEVLVATAYITITMDGGIKIPSAPEVAITPAPKRLGNPALAMADWMLGNGLGVISFLLAVNVILLLAGNFMEPSSIMLIFAPILFPIAMQLGIDPIHLGILMVVNMEVGMCHPPVGLNLYVASGITKMGITELTVAVWPWLLSMLGFLVLVTYWPNLSLWLPRTLGML